MQSFMQMINSLIGLITPLNVLLLLASTCGGILIGALPGLSATMGIALLTGLTYTMSQDMALIVLLGIYDVSLSGDTMVLSQPEASVGVLGFGVSERATYYLHRAPKSDQPRETTDTDKKD